MGSLGTDVASTVSIHEISWLGFLGTVHPLRHDSPADFPTGSRFYGIEAAPDLMGNSLTRCAGAVLLASVFNLKILVKRPSFVTTFRAKTALQKGTTS